MVVFTFESLDQTSSIEMEQFHWLDLEEIRSINVAYFSMLPITIFSSTLSLLTLCLLSISDAWQSIFQSMMSLRLKTQFRRIYGILQTVYFLDQTHTILGNIPWQSLWHS